MSDHLLDAYDLKVKKHKMLKLLVSQQLNDSPYSILKFVTQHLINNYACTNVYITAFYNMGKD